MAALNLYTLASYQAASLAKTVLKNVTGATNFFSYVSRNGTTLTNNQVALIPEDDVQFISPVSRAAIQSGINAGTIKYGCRGCSFYSATVTNSSTTATITVNSPGTIVGVYVINRTGTGGTNAQATNGGNSIMSGTLTLPTATDPGAAEYALTATAADLVLGHGGSVAVTTSTTAGTYSVTYVIAVAHHNA